MYETGSKQKNVTQKRPIHRKRRIRELQVFHGEPGLLAEAFMANEVLQSPTPGFQHAEPELQDMVFGDELLE
ncbi:hypothetical protein AgCh_034927 [Apium graveolens]